MEPVRRRADGPGTGDEGFEVATDTLRGEASIWESKSQFMGVIAARAEELRINRIEAGLYQLVVQPYAEVVNKVTGLCRDAQQRMRAIATTLGRVANVYEEEERRGIHALRNLR